jgi:hypothetical protein
VNMVHNCFAFGREVPRSVRVYGLRSTSLQANQCGLAVRDSPPPRVTRKSEGEEEAWLPSTEELMGCKNADEFRDVVESARVPRSQLWKYPQACLVHRSCSKRWRPEQPESRRPSDRDHQEPARRSRVPRWRGDDDRSLDHATDPPFPLGS